MELDNPILSEISQRQEDEHSMLSFIYWGSKKVNMNTEQWFLEFGYWEDESG